MKKCCGYVCKRGSKNGEYAVWCEVCGRRGKGKSWEDAENVFDHSTPNALVASLVDTPNDAMGVASYVVSHASEMVDIAAPFVRNDRSAFSMMVKKNVRYVENLTGGSWPKVWETPEGRESIIVAMEEAFMLGATLPDMGCIVPYGTVAEFIPSVEAYEFAATTGQSSPFVPGSFHIETVYEEDAKHLEISRKDGNFTIHFGSIPIERGKPVAVAVYGTLRSTGMTIGEVYPSSRLLEKAKAHSPSYRSYMLDIQAFQAAKSEGRVLSENGREYILKTVESKYGDKFHAQDVALFQAAEKAGTLKKDDTGEYVEKKIPGKNGRPEWTKKLYRSEIDNPGTEQRKVYRDEITNPYDGPDAPEMLRKTAGKSFLTPFMRVRNSTAAINEIRDDDDVDAMLDAALGRAYDTVPGASGGATAANSAASSAASEAMGEDSVGSTDGSNEEVETF